MRGRLLLAMILAGAPYLAIAGTGDLDPTFGTGGVVITAFPPPGAQAASEILIQPDGRIVAVGVLEGPTNGGGIGVARYLADGSLDPSFGTGGLVSFVTGLDNATVAHGVLQPDGKIVAAIDVANGPPALFIVRYDDDGTPDTGFGAGGQIVLPGGESLGLQTMAIQQGKLLISMMTGGVWELRRFELSDGSPDAGFGTGGVVAPVPSIGSLVVQPDDKVVLGGRAIPLSAVRLNPDGSPDASFGSGGVASVASLPPCASPPYSTRNVALQPDGKIVVLGDSCHGMTIVRYLANGAPDPSFGMAGVVISQPIQVFDGGGADLVVEPDGHLIVVGGAGLPSQTELLVVRFDPDGALDRTFGAGGRTITPVLDRVSAFAGALQADGRLVLVANGSFEYFVVARYDLACPALPDGDGDGIGDACDPCTAPVVVEVPNVRLTRLAPPAGDEVVRIAGRLSIPLTPAIDPAATGMRLALSDATGAALLYAVLDPDAIVLPPTVPPWRVNRTGTKFTFQPERSGLTPPAGFDKVDVKVLASRSQVKFKALAKGITFAVAPEQLPLEVFLSLDARRSVAGQCGGVRFDPPGPDCVFNPSGNVLTCR